MKVKWSTACDCRMLVLNELNARYDQFEIFYLQKCKEHKGERNTRVVWKHHVIAV